MRTLNCLITLACMVSTMWAWHSASRWKDLAEKAIATTEQVEQSCTPRPAVIGTVPGNSMAVAHPQPVIVAER